MGLSGKKQHFIPKRFVKKFSEQPETKTPKIWFYRYEHPPTAQALMMPLLKDIFTRKQTMAKAVKL